MAGPLLGVVIPTLNEAHRLPRLLSDLARLAVPVEIVVSDGGSHDETRAVARAQGVRCITGARGRAVQMNAGARLLKTPWLLFLHADSRLPAVSRAVLADSLGSPDFQAAYFVFRLEGQGGFRRLVEIGQRLREHTTGLVYGDQGLLVRRKLFEAVGGYPELPLMEDVEIMRRLRRSAGVRRLSAPLLTSPRSYQRYGRWRVCLRNVLAIALYLAGVEPHRLVRWYPERTLAVDGPGGAG